MLPETVRSKTRELIKVEVAASAPAGEVVVR
jgi:hypothetical protein